VTAFETVKFTYDPQQGTGKCRRLSEVISNIRLLRVVGRGDISFEDLLWVGLSGCAL
jgi:hypothetical protein